MGKNFLDELEEYEQLAYDGGFGDDWLMDISEGFKFYIKDCISINKKPTINGFMNYIKDMAKKATPDFENSLKEIRQKIANGESSSFDHGLTSNKNNTKK